MLNFEMISYALETFNVRGFKSLDTYIDYLSNPFALAIFSKSSIDFDINYDIS